MKYPYSITFGELNFIELMRLQLQILLRLPSFCLHIWTCVCVHRLRIGHFANKQTYDYKLLQLLCLSANALPLAHTHTKQFINYCISHSGFKSHLLWHSNGDGVSTLLFFSEEVGNFPSLLLLFFPMNAKNRCFINNIYRSNNDSVHTFQSWLKSNDENENDVQHMFVPWHESNNSMHKNMANESMCTCAHQIAPHRHSIFWVFSSHDFPFLPLQPPQLIMLFLLLPDWDLWLEVPILNLLVGWWWCHIM